MATGDAQIIAQAVTQLGKLMGADTINAIKSDLEAVEADVAGKANLVGGNTFFGDQVLPAAIQPFTGDVPTGTALVTQDAGWANGGGYNVIANPDANSIAPGSNACVILGGRNATYPQRIGDSTEDGGLPPTLDLATIGGGGNNVCNHLAGTIAGGAHNKLLYGPGSHGFIGGGSLNEQLSGHYGVIVGGTNNTLGTTEGDEFKGHKSFIGGGDGNTVEGREGAIAGGFSNAVRGDKGFIGSGELNTANGDYAGVLTGRECKADRDYSSAQGLQAVAQHYGAAAQASGSFATPGDAQTSVVVLRRTTTDATQTQLLPDGDGGTAVLNIGPNSTVGIVATIVATRTDVAGEEAMYRLEALVSNRSGTLTLKSQSLTAIHEDDSTWSADVQVSDPNVLIRGIGAVGKTIRWVARVEFTQVRVLE